MDRTLIVATSSYAGMGPYVSEIVNTFSPDDDVEFFFVDYEDNFFYNNIKKELHHKSMFFSWANSKWNKAIDLLKSKPPYYNRVLKLCIEKDIKVVHFINNPGSQILVRALEQMGVACIGTVHDLHPHESKKEWYKEFRTKILYKRINEELIYAKRLITNSPIQCRELEKCYPEKQIYYHGFPSLVTDVVKRGMDVSHELERVTKPYILFFGRIEEYKGISLLYDVFIKCEELNNSYALVIAGKGTLPFCRVPQERNVVILNRYIKDTEVAYLYQHAACVVYPYISATQSGVLSLAYYFGTPVLTSDVPFFKSIIEESEAGITFENGNMEDLKAKLIILLQTNNRAMKEKGKNYYIGYYDGDAIRRSLLNIYKDFK